MASRRHSPTGFAGLEGETLNEAWERWWRVTNSAIGLLACAAMVLLTTIIGRQELANSPITYIIGLAIPMMATLIAYRLRMMRRRFEVNENE